MARRRTPRQPPRRAFAALKPPRPADDAEKVAPGEVAAMLSSFLAEVEASEAAEEAQRHELAVAERARRDALRALEPARPEPQESVLDRAWAAIDAAAESPIERSLGRMVVIFADITGGIAGSIAVLADRWALFAQYPIGPYRADFALVDPSTYPQRVVVVEADGREFHTGPEAEARDAARDRWMRAKGIRVLRFTGSDIHHHPDRCGAMVLAEIGYFDRKEPR